MPTLKCSILLQNVAPMEKSPRPHPSHSHHFWQLDYYEDAAKVDVGVGSGQKIYLFKSAPAFLIIPPFVTHQIHLCSPCAKCHALKFELDDAEYEKLGAFAMPLSEHPELSARILELAGRGDDISRQMLEHYLSILFLSLRKGRGLRGKCGPDSKISEAVSLICGDLSRSFSVPAIASRLNLSRTHFNRLFQAETGLSPMKFFHREKLRQAVKMLEYSDFDISQISDALGFNDIQSFSRFFKRETGKSPRNYRKTLEAGEKNGAGEGNRTLTTSLEG